MAETATGSTSNGKKVDEGVKKGEPVNVGTALAGTAGKAVGDLKPGTTKVKAETPMDKKKAVSGSKASDEAVAKEASDHKRSAGRGVEKVSVGGKSENMNAGHSKKVLKETKAKEDVETPAKNEMEVDAKKSIEEKDVSDEEGKSEAMEIDDKKQERADMEEEPKVEQKAGIVLNPKKKLGRPKKIKDTDEKSEEPMSPVTETKKRPRQKKEPVTPQSERDRPSRERKSIERFVASVEKEKKELIIKQGAGTALMDIPNVAFKLSKRGKGDEILHMLHSLLYNQRAKANVLKYNIFRFSGFVWTENEEKERLKVREKLERFTKEGLGQLIDVLDLHLTKTGKKEELVCKVLEFLDSPHKTTDVILEEWEQKMKEKKRKSRTPAKGKAGSTSKRRKVEDSSSTKKRGKRKNNESEEETGDYANSSDESLEEEEVEGKRLTFVDEHDDDEEEEDDEDDEDYQAKQKPQKRTAKPAKEEQIAAEEEKVSHEDESEGDQVAKRSSAKSTSSASTRAPPSPDISKSSSKPAEKVYTKGSRKKTKESKETEEAPVAKRVGKQKAISKEKVPEKATGRGRRGKAKEPPVKKKRSTDIPSDDVLRNEICDLLKDLRPADFSKVTFMDVVIQLEEKFNVDLSVKKSHVKLLIRQEVSRLAEEGEDEDEDQEGTEVEGEAMEAEAEVKEVVDCEAADMTEGTGTRVSLEADETPGADQISDADVAPEADEAEEVPKENEAPNAVDGADAVVALDKGNANEDTEAVAAEDMKAEAVDVKADAAVEDVAAEAAEDVVAEAAGDVSGGDVKAEAAEDVKINMAEDVKAHIAEDVKTDTAEDGKTEAVEDGEAEATGDVKTVSVEEVKAVTADASVSAESKESKKVEEQLQTSGVADTTVEGATAGD